MFSPSFSLFIKRNQEKARRRFGALLVSFPAAHATGATSVDPPLARFLPLSLSLSLPVFVGMINEGKAFERQYRVV